MYLGFPEPANEHDPRPNWRRDAPLALGQFYSFITAAPVRRWGGLPGVAFLPRNPGRWFRQVAAAGFFGEHWELMEPPGR